MLMTDLPVGCYLLQEVVFTPHFLGLSFVISQWLDVLDHVPPYGEIVESATLFSSYFYRKDIIINPVFKLLSITRTDAFWPLNVYRKIQSLR